MEALERAQIWQSAAVFDARTKEAAAEIFREKESLLECFGQELAFGTGGLRGVLGTGTNRMNIYTVARATLGLAAWLKATGGKSVAIAYDSRIGSRDFAGITAGVLARQHIQAFLYDRLMPTPMLSFAVRELHCDAGVVITASHNPAQYNGYKVYGADGCQITEEAAAAITACIEEADYASLQWLTEEEARNQGLLLDIPQTVYDAFIQKTLDCRVRAVPFPHPLRLVYTPLHGTGLEPVRSVLSRMPGIERIEAREQCIPDGNFPTCKRPNPELREALEMALSYARQEQADLVVATDPDCDRVGVAIREDDGFKVLTGNEVGLLLMEYILSHRQRHPGKEPVVIKTIVTSDLAFPIARKYGARVKEVLTGFKYIGEAIGRMEAAGEAGLFAFGFEESCGYLAGTHVRDKDGVMACMLVAEMAQDYAAQGQTLAQALAVLYKTYGYMGTRLLNFDIHGALPMEAMATIMKKLREHRPAAVCGRSVACAKDYAAGIKGLPKSDVLSYQNDSDAKAIVRPSGTEPKVKVYLSAKGNSADEARELLSRMTAEAEEWLGMKSS